MGRKRADIPLICERCGELFFFTVGEQRFYAEKGLLREPRLCPRCREERRHKPRRYVALCSRCHTPVDVPFLPFEDREVLCERCRRESSG